MDNKDNEVVYLHLDDIIPNRFQPRQIFDEKALKELAVSIKEHGVIQPIIVRNIGNKYEIIAGERRYKASAMAGLTTIPAIVRNLDDKESSKVALLENLQRKNLNPIEEAKTYQKILEIDQMTQEELAKTMGKSQSAVANKLRLLSLTDEVQDALLKDEISERHARTLLNAPDSEAQKKLLKEVIDNKMTVRELEEKLKPKEEITKEDVRPIFNTEQQPNNVNTIFNTNTNFNNSNANNVSNANNFNNSIGIDYSTPPKFIDYDIPNINENLESTAGKTIDINQIKDTARDINAPMEEPQKDINEFLKAAPKNDQTQTSSQEFKFFSPIDDGQKNDSQPKNEESSNQIFNTPTPSNVPFATDPFSLGEEKTKDLKDSTSTSMDNLLAGVENKEEPKIPTVDEFNNPFAKNPIFQDNISSINQTNESKPKYTLNESINMVRETVKKIEDSGFKTDVEEMDFLNNYQIVIKISKENNNQ